MDTTLRHACSRIFSVGMIKLPAALFTSASTRPNFSMVVSMAPRTEAADVTSRGTAKPAAR